MARPENVATPATAALVLLVIEEPTLPPTSAAVTVDVSAFTTAPLASSTVTTGWTASATPLAAVAEGSSRDHQFGRGTGDRHRCRAAEVETASVKVSPAMTVSMGAVMARPLKVATPATAAFVLLANELPAPVNAAVTVEVSVVTMLPPESSTSTTGCGVSATPLTAPVTGAVGQVELPWRHRP